MHPDANLAMLLTPPGAAAIAVVRIIGPMVTSFLQSHFSEQVKPLRPVHGELRDGQTLIDDPVVVLAADSTWADLNLHGGAWVIEATLRLCERSGFHRVNALQCDRAFDADSTIEREVLQALPLARTEFSLRALLAQQNAWEAMERTPPTAAEACGILDDRALDHLLHSPAVAIVGIPNAGKSTLANQLFAQQRAITADLPGTTRDWVGEIANIDGLAVKLIDTPGLRETGDAIEQAAIHQSREIIEQSQMVLLLLDVSQTFESQQPLIERFPRALRLANKIDRPASWDPASADVQLCAQSGRGVQQVRDAIRKFFGCLEMNLDQPRCWTERQRCWLADFASSP